MKGWKQLIMYGKYYNNSDRFQKRGGYKGSNARGSRSDYMDNTQYAGVTRPSSEGEVQNYISLKALKDLPKSSYSIQADPYTAALPGAEPYPILAKFNKTVGGAYGGVKNIDGGTAQQYANSNRSKLLNLFDFMRLKIAINYRYLPSRLAGGTPSSEVTDGDYVGAGLIDQQRQAIAEGTSQLQATTFTNMAIYHYAIETDMPMGNAKLTKVTIGGRDHYLYTNLSDVIFGATRYYQIVLQSIVMFINWHNSFRLKMGTCIRSSWNRETPALNALFSLFKKKSFLALLDSTCLSLPGEYIDVDWATQANALSLRPSRRSNSMTDPVLELQTQYIHPLNFKLWLMDDNNNVVTDKDNKPLFDQTTDLAALVPEGSGTVLLNLFDAIDDINNFLSAEYAVAWARADMTDEDGQKRSDNNYFNYVKYRVDVINTCLTKFKIAFNDIREVLDVRSRTGIVSWQKGFRPTITASTDAALFDNKIVDDIYSTLFAGPTSVKMDAATKRWKTFAYWNMYFGIPEYDARSGGCFLTFSGKNIDTSDDKDHVYQYVPQMFVADQSIIDELNAGTVIKTVNRLGKRRYIKAKEIAQPTAVEGLSHLFILPSQDSYTVRVPVAYKPSSTGTIDTPTLSGLHNTMIKVFGAYADVDQQEETVTRVATDPDLLAVYDLEIEDITNDAIAYARTNAVFKGATSFSSELGFETFGGRGKTIA